MIAEAPVSVQGSETRSFTDRAVFDQNGVRAHLRPQGLYIQLPSVTDDTQFPAVYMALQRIYDRGYNHVDWTVDVSALRAIPLSLLSVLTSFRQELSEEGFRLTLTGARPESFPKLYLQSGSLFTREQDPATHEFASCVAHKYQGRPTRPPAL